MLLGEPKRDTHRTETDSGAISPALAEHIFHSLTSNTLPRGEHGQDATPPVTY